MPPKMPTGPPPPRATGPVSSGVVGGGVSPSAPAIRPNTTSTQSTISINLDPNGGYANTNNVRYPTTSPPVSVVPGGSGTAGGAPPPQPNWGTKTPPKARPSNNAPQKVPPVPPHGPLPPHEGSGYTQPQPWGHQPNTTNNSQQQGSASGTAMSQPAILHAPPPHTPPPSRPGTPSTSLIVPPQNRPQTPPLTTTSTSTNEPRPFSAQPRPPAITPPPISQQPVMTHEETATATSNVVSQNVGDGDAQLSYVSVVSRLGGNTKLYKLTLKGDVSRLPVTTLKRALQAFTALPAQDMILTKDGVRLEDYMVGADVELVPGSILHLDIAGGPEDRSGRVSSQSVPLMPLSDAYAAKISALSPPRSYNQRDEIAEFTTWTPHQQVQHMIRMKQDIEGQMKRLEKMNAIWLETMQSTERTKQISIGSTTNNGGGYYSGGKSNVSNPTTSGRTGSVGAYQFTDYRSGDPHNGGW